MNFPKRVTLELTNRCNRSCSGCPRHQMRYPQGDMDAKLWQAILNQLPCDTVIVPFYRGEPTLHPQFPKLMRELKRFTDVQFATNGDNQTPQIRTAIYDNCTFVSLSLHEPTLPDQTKHLPFLYGATANGLTTQVSIVDSVLPPDQKQAFTEKWSRHVDRVRIYTEHSADGFGSMPGLHPVEACQKPFNEMVVYWDGKVGLCNHDWNNETPLGDLNLQSIREVWASSKYQAVRAFHTMRLRRQIESCRSCSFESNKTYGEIMYGRQIENSLEVETRNI